MIGDDAWRLVRGEGSFVADRIDADTLHLAVLRSPVAYGRIRRLDVRNASAQPGVVAVLTAGDLEALGIGALRCRTPVTGDEFGPMVEPPRPVLAVDRVVHVGQPVAAVVANSPAAAAEAIDAVDFDVEPAPAIVDVEAALAAAAPTLWPEAPDNVGLRWAKGDQTAAEAAFARAAHVVTLTVRHPRVAPASLETRGAIARVDAESGCCTLWTPSQGVVMLRSAMAETLGLPLERVRVVTEDVGGSFAVKIWPYPEHVLVLAAARLTGAAVAWIASRTESFVADVPGRARIDRARLALDAEGRFLAFAIDALADIGAFWNTAAPSIVTVGATRVMGHVYRIPAMHYRVAAVFTTAAPTDAYRGAGKPETVATLERLIDRAAAELGIERLDLRRRNLITPDELPYRTAMDETIDAGDMPALADRLANTADLAGFAARREASTARGRWRGLGITFHLHATGGSTNERSEVRALPDGTVRVRSGSQDTGQGHRRALALVAGGALDLAADRVLVEQGDSGWLPVGGGTGGSNLMPVVANTVHRAVLTMLDQARARAADVLEAGVEDLHYEQGVFRVRGTDRSVAIAELAARDAAAGDDTPACVATCDFEGVHTTFPSGGYAVEIELDPETGSVRIDSWCGLDDLGRVVDPPGALGQLQGGIAQAVGEVVGEALLHDAAGQLLTGSFMDYPLPRATDLPAFALGFASTPSPNSLLGVKGVGEVGSIGGVAAVVNAIHDALAAAGIEHLDRPLTPAKLWHAIAHRSGKIAP